MIIPSSDWEATNSLLGKPQDDQKPPLFRGLELCSPKCWRPYDVAILSSTQGPLLFACTRFSGASISDSVFSFFSMKICLLPSGFNFFDDRQWDAFGPWSHSQQAHIGQLKAIRVPSLADSYDSVIHVWAAVRFNLFWTQDKDHHCQHTVKPCTHPDPVIVQRI